MKYCEIIALNRNAVGVGAASQRLILDGRTIWIVDAHRGDGKRFVVHADESLSALWELESVIRGLQNWFDELAGFSPNSASPNGSELGGGLSPARFFASSRPAVLNLVSTSEI